MNLKQFLVEPGTRIKLSDYDTGYTGGESRKKAEKKFKRDAKCLAELQNMLYAGKKYAVLGIEQAMDGAGKDSAVNRLTRYINTVGMSTVSYGAPTEEELAHDFLWRHRTQTPRPGHIRFWIRSHYEEVGIVRVHPEFLEKRGIQRTSCDDALWEKRYSEINAFEQSLAGSGIMVMKFFIHISQEEQAKQLLERIDDPTKHWKFNPRDIEERALWPHYMPAYEKAISATSMSWAPWYIIPGDHRWFARRVMANIFVKRMERLGLEYPKLSKEKRAELARLRKQLMHEK